MKNSGSNKFSGLLREKLPSILFIILLLSITSIITYFKIKIQISISPQWDTFDFLANALYFSGNGFGYVDFMRPPFLPFLTSIFFRLGYISEITIFAVDGILFVLGVIGLYLFLKLRFNDIASFLGALIFISFPVVLLWVGAGYTDVASMSLSIWSLYFFVLAVKKNPKFFYLSFPLATLAFLTRFPAIIMLFPMIFYLLINKNSFKELKSITGSIIVSILIFIPVLVFFYEVLGNPLSFFLQLYGGTTGTIISDRFAYNPDIFYYIKSAIYCIINMDSLNNSSLLTVIVLAAGEIIVICSFLMGLTIYFHKILKSHENINFKNYLNPEKSKSIQIYITIAILVFFLATFNKVSYLLSDFAFLMLSYMFYNLLKSNNLKNLDLDFLFIVWLVSYLIFNSVFQIKVCRYFIPMTPAIAYFIVLGLNEFSGKIKLKVKNIHLTSVLSIFLALVVLLSINSYFYQLENNPLAHGLNFKINSENQESPFEIISKPYSKELYFENYNTLELKSMSRWLENYDHNYKNKIIYSDYFWPHLSWYLKNDVKGIPNQDKSDLDHELRKQNADYYINILYNVNLRSYSKLKEFQTTFGKIIIYKRS